MADEDAIPVNIDSVCDCGQTSLDQTKWNIPTGDRPDAESAPSLPPSMPAAEMARRGFSDE